MVPHGLRSALYTDLYIELQSHMWHAVFISRERVMADGRVEDIYDQVKQMAVSFGIRPGDRLNEGALARELGVSRTPLREALNRLVAEKMVDFRPGTGFFCRELEPQTIFDLYEVRKIVECAAARLACDRASDAELAALGQSLRDTGLTVADLTVAQACSRDEAFHRGIVRLSGNAVLATQLEQVNERIRYIRWVSLTPLRLRHSKEEHVQIMEALTRRDGDATAEVLGRHIDRRMDQVVDSVKQGIANIFMNTTDEMTSRVIGEDVA